MKPITYFRVKPWKYISKIACGNLLNKYESRYNDYYLVAIFETYEDMYKYADRHFEEPDLKHNFSAICKYFSHTYYEDGKYIDVDKCCGWLLFCKNDLGSGTVHHECTHAITYYFKYRINNCNNLFKVHEYDELFAYMNGSISRQIYNRLYEKKVIS